MNEISNFCNGECTGEDDTAPISKKEYLEQQESYDKWLRDSHRPDKAVNQYSGFNPVSPPYAIDNQGNRIPLNIKTISPDATHYGGVLEYNVHNLFGKDTKQF